MTELQALRAKSAYQGPRTIITLVIVSIGLILAVRLLGDMRVATKLPDSTQRMRILFADALGLIAILPVHYLVWFFLQLLIDISDSLILGKKMGSGDCQSPVGD